MTQKMLALTLVASMLSMSAPAFAADCAGLADKELKACEKENKKAAAAAKQDERSEPLLPSAIDASLAAWDAPEKNPFATDAYRVRVTKTEIASVDAYLAKVFGIQGTVTLGRWVVDEVGKGNADAVALLPKMLPMVQKAVGDGQSLVSEGQALVTSLPAEMVGPQALKLPKTLTALKDGITALTSTVKEAPAIVTSLGSVNPGAAAGAAAGAGAEAVMPK